LIKQLWTLVDYVINNQTYADPRLFPSQQPPSVIWSFQNSSRIEKPYIVLNYTSVDVPDHEYYDAIDAQGNRQVSSWRKAVVDMQFYAGPDSYIMASRFVSRLAMDLSLDKQAELDCAIGTRLMLARVPAMLNESQYEDRAIYTFEFYYTESQIEFVSLIETVIVDGTYTGAATGDITCTETITVTQNLTP